MPLHADCAHWSTPPRYLILGCQEPGDARCPTYMWNWRTDLSADQLKLFRDALYLVRNGTDSFYAHALAADDGFLRFDMACMIAKNRSAQTCNQLVSGALDTGLQVASIHWERGDVVIADNWAVLHGRSTANNSLNRRLVRVLVRGK